MPTSTTRKTTEKPEQLALVDTPAVTEALADDVAAETATFAPGTPELLPHLKMPRVRRAKAYGALGAVQTQNQKVNPKAASGDEQGEDAAAQASAEVEVDPSEYGDRYLVLGLIEEYLAICAVDEAAFRAWALDVDDSALIKAFNVYMKVNQPGEATSSAS